MDFSGLMKAGRANIVENCQILALILTLALGQWLFLIRSEAGGEGTLGIALAVLSAAFLRSRLPVFLLLLVIVIFFLQLFSLRSTEVEAEFALKSQWNFRVQSAAYRSYDGAFRVSLTGAGLKKVFARVPAEQDICLGHGSMLELKGRLEVWSRDENRPDPSSWQGYLFRKGYQGFLRVGEVLKVESKSSGCPRSRAKLIDRLFESFAGQEEALTVQLAATIGEKSLPGERVTELFKRAGLSHLLVVSGFHTGVVFTLVWSVLSFLLRSFDYYQMLPRMVLLSLFGLIASCYYVWIAGGEQATVRALLMLSLLSLARILGAKVTSVRNLLLTALGFLSFWPGAWLDMGPQLIFSALTGIILALKLADRVITETGILDRLTTGVFVSLLAWFFTAPVIYFWTEQLNPLQPVNNLLVTPLFSFFTIGLGLVALAFFQLGIPGSQHLVGLSLKLTETVIWVVDSLDRLAGSTGGWSY